MDFTKIKDTVTTIFSGDNSVIDYTHVSSAVLLFAIMSMWLYKSSQIVGGMADFPPGVQMVIFALVGVAPVTAAVNTFRALKTKISTSTNTVSVSTPVEDGDPKP